MKSISRIALLFIPVFLNYAVFADTPQYARVGEPAPPFTLPTLNGSTMSLSSCRGRILVLHFGASWCPFCRAEDPHLEALYQEYKDRGVDVIVIDVKEPEHLAIRWIKRANYSFPMLLDEDGAVAASYMPPGELPDLPRDEAMVASNLLIDRNGVVRFFSLLDTKAFDARLTKLRATLDELLKESP